jgi:hypothetical protein
MFPPPTIDLQTLPRPEDESITARSDKPGIIVGLLPRQGFALSSLSSVSCRPGRRLLHIPIRQMAVESGGVGPEPDRCPHKLRTAQIGHCSDWNHVAICAKARHCSGDWLKCQAAGFCAHPAARWSGEPLHGDCAFAGTEITARIARRFAMESKTLRRPAQCSRPLFAV